MKTQLLSPMVVTVLVAMAGCATTDLAVPDLTVVYRQKFHEEKRAQIEKFLVAAEQGNAEAQYNLSKAYRDAIYYTRKEKVFVGEFTALGGKVADKHRRVALHWLRKAAEQGYAKAQYKLGLAYACAKSFCEGSSLDASENKDAARHWFHKAAEQGYADAQYTLGLAYAGWDNKWRGLDKREQRSIAAGYTSAMASIMMSGARLSNWGIRLGVSINLDEARHWFHKAAEHGHAKAQKALTHFVKDESKNQPALSENIAIAPAPKRVNMAAHVFGQTWRSVVVVINGDSQGSGVIIRPNIVVTNCHVVNEGGGITVHKAHNRRANTDTAYSATIRHADKNRDFCLLDIAGLWGVPATVRRYDTLNVGDDVYALGAPRGLDLSLSDGLVSQLRMRNGYRVIQTNAEISPGSSGGGLFDSEGNLVGIVTAKFTDEGTEGIGFAIPADLTLEY